MVRVLTSLGVAKLLAREVMCFSWFQLFGPGPPTPPTVSLTWTA